MQLQLAFYQQGSYTRVMVMSIILPTQLWTVQHLLLFAFSSFPFFLITSLIFLLFTKTSLFLPDLSSFHKTRFFFKIIQHCETWNVIGLFPSCKLEEIELILFFKSCIIQIFVHQVCMNSLFYTVKLVES